MKHIQWLKKHGACAEGLAFARKYPTLQAAWDACTSLDHLKWVANAPIRAEYEAKRAPIWAEYEAKRAPIRAEYRAKRDAIWAEYEAKNAPIWAEYEAKCATIWAEYEAKRAPIRAEYEAKRDAIGAARTCDELRATVSCPELLP